MKWGEAEDLGLALEESEVVETAYKRDQLIASRYRLVRPLAKGGMSELWVAQHADLNNEVVVKFLRPTMLLDSDGLVSVEERFKLEAQLTAQLAMKTKFIVKGLDWGTHRGVPYLVIELVRGKTLAATIALGPLELPLFAKVIEQVAEALEVAHGAGIIHRDLKPGNILLGSEAGELVTKVADFGVAKAKRTSLFIERPTDTSVNHVVGSPAYSSPEQLYGRELDGRSDVWSLGVVAYESLTGQRPFRLETDGEVSLTELSVVIATAPFVPPSTLRPALPRALDRWFERALAKVPDDRFASAAEASTALHEALTKRVVPKAVLQGLAAILAVAAPLAIVLALREPHRATPLAAPPPPAVSVATPPLATSLPAVTAEPTPEEAARSSAPSPSATSPATVRPRGPAPKPTALPKPPAPGSPPKAPDPNDVF